MTSQHLFATSLSRIRNGAPRGHEAVTQSSQTRAAASHLRDYGRGMSSDPRHHIGRLGEELALAHLERLGFRLVARNHRTRFGELDIIVADDRALVFVEVKTRRAGPGHPWWNLGTEKQGRVRAMARSWLAEVTDRPRGRDVRFDAIGVVVDAADRLVRLDHLEAAF